MENHSLTKQHNKRIERKKNKNLKKMKIVQNHEVWNIDILRMFDYLFPFILFNNFPWFLKHILSHFFIFLRMPGPTARASPCPQSPPGARAQDPGPWILRSFFCKSTSSNSRNSVAFRAFLLYSKVVSSCPAQYASYQQLQYFNVLLYLFFLALGGVGY